MLSHCPGFVLRQDGASELSGLSYEIIPQFAGKVKTFPVCDLCKNAFDFSPEMWYDNPRRHPPN